MWNWIVKHKVLLLVGIASLIAGFLLNKWANKMSEERIINRFVEEIKKIKC